MPHTILPLSWNQEVIDECLTIEKLSCVPALHRSYNRPVPDLPEYLNSTSYGKLNYEQENHVILLGPIHLKYLQVEVIVLKLKV